MARCSPPDRAHAIGRVELPDRSPFQVELGVTHCMHIALETPNQPEVISLIEELDAYVMPLYPAESHHGLGVAALCAPNVLFAVARDERGHAVACGAMVLEATYGEVKRMFTRPICRGKGLARQLLEFLEGEAAARGYRTFFLETGFLQPEALRLYEKHGYSRCGPFGSYLADPNSVFMRKVREAQQH